MNKEKVILINTIDRVKRFTQKVSVMDAEVDIVSGRYIVDAKSIMGIFSLDILKPLTVIIHSEDEEEINKFNEIMEEFKVDDKS